LSFANIDYLTVSLGKHSSHGKIPTGDVLKLFASILPKTYKNTCRDMLNAGGRTKRVVQYGICVALQYGTAISRGWLYSVQLSAEYWHTVEHNRKAVLNILGGFEDWRVSRLDLEKTVLVLLDDFQEFCISAFEKGCFMTGANNARTVTFGSRKAQFYTRIYNKTANDPKHYPAPDGMAQVRLEVEIHRVSGELILEPAFLNPEFAEKLYVQRVRRTAENDCTGFIGNYFDSDESFGKIKTVKRTVGNLESTVEYVFKAYKSYIQAGLRSENIKKLLGDDDSFGRKAEKILAVLEQGGGAEND
jgi:hypothetical protein